MAITKIQSESMNLADTYAFTGTVTGAGESNTPAFHAYSANGDSQALGSSATTKVKFQTELYDTNSAYDHSTNFRFTVPSGQAGKYEFTANVGFWTSGSAYSRSFIMLYKNGSEYLRHERRGGTSIYAGSYAQNNLIFTTTDNASVGDYYEVYSYIGADANTYNSSSFTMANYFKGFKISS